MRWSTLFIPTLRDAPADAEAASHRLLVRGGFIRQLQSGHYSLLPLGHRVAQRVTAIIREEIDAIGGQEFLLPTMHPAALWQRSGRWETMGEEMFRLRDRKGADLALGMTHEEVFTHLAEELASYRDLPQLWYQFQVKFRDEPRPKSGLLRVREFTMKDSYSFDLDEAGLDRQFDAHHEAYTRIFRRLGLDSIPVEASSGTMGGSDSIEFMVESPAGEDDVVRCPGCGYAANVERATAALVAVADQEPPAEPEPFPTPGIRTIEALAEAGAPADRQIKTLVYRLDGELTLVLLRGDHPLELQKLVDATGATDVRAAEAADIRAALGADPGSLGAVGVTDLPILADLALQGRTDMTTGANEDDVHLRGVDIARDIRVDTWHDLRRVDAGEPCARCGTALEVIRCIEAGHIFKLGRRYTEALGVTVLDADGEARTPIMGSYGIGVGRAVAAVVEAHHDDDGICWPVEVAPYQVVVTVIRPDEATMAVVDDLERGLAGRGLSVLVDDRDERPGVKFADAELIGVPFRVTVGPKGIDNGVVELTPRATGERRDVPLADAVDEIVAAVDEARFAPDAG